MSEPSEKFDYSAFLDQVEELDLLGLIDLVRLKNRQRRSLAEEREPLRQRVEGLRQQLEDLDEQVGVIKRQIEHRIDRE